MLQKFSSRFLLWSSTILAVGLLLSALLPNLNPGRYWLAGFSGFFFPLLFIICSLLIPVLWWCKMKKQLLLCGIAVLCSISAARATWGIHIFRDNKFVTSPLQNKFTLMTYNTSNMGLVAYKTDERKAAAIYDIIRTASPDILCMQEFYSNDNPEKERHIDSIMRTGQYTYHYFTCDKTHWNTWYYGIALFSRYRVLSAAAIPCGGSIAGSGSSFLQADLLIKGDTIRVFSVQLTSYMFNGGDYDHMKAPAGAGLVYKMRSTFPKRSAQALQLAELLAQSPYPAIVCGDFNDTPVSFTYNTVSRNMQDAFLETGNGLGRTLSFLSPTLRIDYLLAQPSFNIHTGAVFRIQPSEHFPVMACLSLKKH
jgi:endonuclease/exonuclease/phosphatase family metal-dependent hydrolase